MNAKPPLEQSMQEEQIRAALNRHWHASSVVALNLLHAAALDFVLIRRISGSNLGPDFGDGDNPTRDAFKSKADVVKFVQEAVADGAQVIQQQGDAGLDKTSKFFGNRLAHNSSIWMFAIEHSGEHYGQLVVYHRANNLVPPDSRR